MMIPTLVGYPKLTKGVLQSSVRDDQTFVGIEALKRSPLLSLKYPIEHGIILDWEEISLLLDHAGSQCMKLNFQQLNSGLMMTEAPLNPKKNRERLTQLVFEHYQVPKF